jgi:REP element-mobilizing transposase RayT
MDKESSPLAFESVGEFSRYRRHLPHLQLPGSVYFCTASTKFRNSLSPAERDLVYDAIQFHRDRKYELFASVVMPDHFHLILRPLEKNDAGLFSLSEIFHSIKSWSANQIGKLRSQSHATASHATVLGSREGKSRAGMPDLRGVAIWQDETYDHIMRNDEDYSEKFYYTIYNPVEAGLVEKPDDYRWLWYQGKPEVPRSA